MKKIMLVGIILTGIQFMNFAVAQTNENTNYCHNKESWVEWDNLVTKYPDDMDIQMLHAVRIGLCRKVENKTISFESATKIFNELQLKVSEKAKAIQKQLKEASEL